MLVRKFPRLALLILLTASLTLAACNVGATPAPTVDIDAINTAAVATAMGQISAQQTETALAAPSATASPTNTTAPLVTLALPTTATGATAPAGSTPGALPTLSFNSTPNTNTTPIAGFTPLSGSPVAPVNTAAATCHNSAYVSDVTVPDDTVLRPGVNFDKTWRIQNTGTCAWDDGFQLVFVSGDQAMDPSNYVIDEASEFVDSGETVDVTVGLTAPLTEGTYTANYRMQTDTGVFFGETIYVRIVVQD
jgi:hypothetical protein